MRAWVVVVLAFAACKEREAERTRPTPSPTRPGSPPTTPPDASQAGSLPFSADPRSRTPQPFHESAEGTTKPAEATRIDYRVTWANVISVAPTCWFFSGPDGRDTPLGDRMTVRIDGGRAWATWGKATFEGTWGDDSIDVVRVASHNYDGPWSVFERLHGKTKEKGIHAKYTYDECKDGTKCVGECRITADVLLVPDR